MGAGDSVTAGRYVLVDQFGYRPQDPKVAVLVDPQTGFNAADSFGPGATYEVRKWSDGAVVFTGAPSTWNGGATQASSGDKGFWFDFSAVTTPGSYYVYDVERQVRSARFEVAADVYREVLKAATRMFFYNRAGAAKKVPAADACWEDDAAYLGAGQDGEARSVSDKQNAATARDLRGGWFDAGDTNKYVTFAYAPVHRLLTAYRERPAVWTDDFRLPESGNGVPDVLDEVKWETDWMKRMQQTGGGVLIKVGVIDYNDVSPPSNDRRPRYYAPVCSSSTIAAAAVFAHAASVFATIPSLAAEAADLKQRAISAWAHYQQNPKQTDCDTQEIKAGDADWSTAAQLRASVVAAVYLFAATADATYSTYVRDNYRSTWPYQDIGWTRYAAEEGEALLYYSSLPNADATVAAAVRADKKTDATTYDDVYRFVPNKDLYQAFITDSTYHWGSHQPRANSGTSNLDALTYAVGVTSPDSYRDRALGVLHYFHGVNPLGVVYLSNMGALGAESSLNSIYHQWFAPGTKWSHAKTSACGPAPGFLPGGPNASYGGSITPPQGQPRQKAYRDWNAGSPENSWEITEPGIYYQAAYVKLVSAFVP